MAQSKGAFPCQHRKATPHSNFSSKHALHVPSPLLNMALAGTEIWRKVAHEMQLLATAESMVRRSRIFVHGLLLTGTRVPRKRGLSLHFRLPYLCQGCLAQPCPTHRARVRCYTLHLLRYGGARRRVRPLQLGTAAIGSLCSVF